MYQLIFYVPESHKESVKAAVFEAGAGKVGEYDCCSWEVLGQGQFKPGKNSQPFIGTTDSLETLPEFRVEMVCHKNFITTALEALISTHPYEEPAYSVVEIQTLDDL